MPAPATRAALVRLVLGGLAVAGFTAGSVGLYVRGTAAPEPKRVEPQKLFSKWPDPAQRKPELVLVLTGQMHGYLQKCGCSNPQKGGLERRYNFIESMKARGWEVVGLDVGDLPRPLPYSPTPEQTLTKYEFGMKALQVMGYKAIALGSQEMALPTLNGLSKYSLQKGNEYPRVLAVNVTNKNGFPDANGGSMIGGDEVIAAKSGLKVGVVGVIGAEVMQRGVDKAVTIGPAGAAVNGVLANWKKAGTHVNVMLYQGPLDWKTAGGQKADAESAAQNFPDFHIILCKTPDESDAPLQPTMANGGRTMIVQVGQRGQTVGVVGIYKGPAGETELYYERVVMSDEFETPADQEKQNAVLNLLQEYSDTVKDNDYLSEMAKRKKLHAVQAQAKGAAFAGDAACAVCHQAETQVYAQTKHAHAYEALEKIAKHPKGRNFDGECIICHTVGYEYQTGYVNAKETPHLKNVQCESCHGPASLHVAEEQANLKKKANQQVHTTAKLLSPWKAGGDGRMPSLDKLEAYARESDVARKQTLLTKPEYEMYLRVYEVCARCHDLDNDPHFKLEEYWKKIAHTGLGKKK
ncbi:MAG TPA: multiheme c-type cytochrome [Gemmataceae bacterium]|jgi:2',3'-cyclic-nucleotide 2'-phosphodiesterase (5'-nucleotidase family)|nr:multiheme c-type cytochrome [Gemmataceae bacterium]